MPHTKLLDIDLLSFITSGKFHCIKLGQTKEWITNNFSDPDETYKDNYNSPIWFYGNVEFHFDENEILFLIYSDHIDTLNGGQSIRLQKWIFNDPENLTLGNVVCHLVRERITFKLEFGTLSSGYTSATIVIEQSQVKLSFTLPENEEEDYEQYLVRCNSEDSNLFRLFSFSLMTK